MQTYQAPDEAPITAQRELRLAEEYHRRAMECRAAGYVQSAILNLTRAAEHRAAARKLAPPEEERWTLTAAGRAALVIRPCDRCGTELGHLPAGAPGRGYDRCADCDAPWAHPIFATCDRCEKESAR